MPRASSIPEFCRASIASFLSLPVKLQPALFLLAASALSLAFLAASKAFSTFSADWLIVSIFDRTVGAIFAGTDPRCQV